CRHQSVKPLSVERSLDLIRVALPYSCELIRINDTALQRVCVLVGFELVRNEIVLRMSFDPSHGLCIPHHLELQVMYRHDRLDAAVVFAEISEIIKIDRDQSCLPVVAVDQIRTETDHRKDAEDCLGEECKLLDPPLRIPVIRCEPAEIV